MKKNLTIIGAGLSGLYAAFLLQDKYNITILEASNKIGGRIVTIDGFDLGPSWVWNHHTNIIKLINTLNLDIYPQYIKGNAIYDDKDDIKRFNPPKSMPSFRIKGGMYKIIEALEKNIKAKILTNFEVIKIQDFKNKVLIKTKEKEFESDYVLLATPPRIAEKNISFEPKLDTQDIHNMQNIATWMAHSAKCVIEYKEAFWKDDNLSGFAFSHFGPLGEVHDASTQNKAALFGFFATRANINEEEVIKQLVRLFGKEAQNYINFQVIDWKKEKYTSTSEDSKINYDLFKYGLDMTLYNEKIHFIGTEYSHLEGGYLEGAIISAKNICKKLEEI